MTPDLSYSELVRRDRAVLVSAIAVLAGLAWAYTVRLSAGMGSMSVNAMAASVAVPSTQSWTLNDVFFMFVMWTVMMVAMMLPSATPMVLLFARVMRKRERDGRPFVPTGLFVFGYLLVWVGFSAMATLANWGLHVAGLLSSMMGSTTPMIGGFVLLFAGAGMALGSWLGGAVFDATDTYRTAFLIGVAFNTGNLAIIASLIARTPRFRPAYA